MQVNVCQTWTRLNHCVSALGDTVIVLLLTAEHLDASALQLHREVNYVVQLVELGADPTLSNHIANDRFSLLRRNTQKSTNSFKGNVEVDLGENVDVVLQCRLEKDRVVVLVSGFLMSCQAVFLE